MRFSGVLAPIPTPFDTAGQLDVPRLRRAFSYWLPTGLAGFVVLGSNGEAVLLDDEEGDRFIAAAREMVPPDRLCIVGTGRESTVAAVKAAKRAAALGADAVLVRTPGFFKAQMTAEAFLHHYREVADQSPVPVLLYNFTAVTGVNLLPPVVAELALHPNIVGIKESGGDIAQLTALVSSTPGSFSVLAGSAATFYSSLTVGARGGILALAGVLPDACVKLFEFVRAGDHAAAMTLQQQLFPVSRLLGAHGVAGLKSAMKIVGCDVGNPRAPLLPLPASAMDSLQSALTLFREARYEPAT